MAFAIVILIVAFGSVLAMGLPVGVALFSISLGTAIITLLSQVLTIPDFATFLGIMIGLGVGIDCCSSSPTASSSTPATRCGSRWQPPSTPPAAPVLFAGITVVISLLGMLLMGVTFIQGLPSGRPRWWRSPWRRR